MVRFPGHHHDHDPAAAPLRGKLFRRRAALRGAAGLLAAQGAGAAPGARHAERWLAPIRAAVAALGGPGLIPSYVVRRGASATLFDRVQANAAFTYDNALAGLALIAAGEARLAGRIGEALGIAQATDRRGFSGRVRNAYQPGPMTDPPKLAGWRDGAAGRWFEDPYQTGTASGVLAWTMLLWLALDRASGTRRFESPCQRAAAWLESVRAAEGYRGGVLGDGAGRLDFVSTEENLDIGAALVALGRQAAAAPALAFVRAMWDPRAGRFDAGLTPAGARNPLAAADANLWPQIAAAMPERLRPALRFVLARLGQRAGKLWGIGFSAGFPGVWLEGTAFAALALRMARTPPAALLAERFAATLDAETAPGGFIYACSTPALHTGLATAGPGSAPFLYLRRPALAPTAWAVLASLGRSPFGPALPADLV